MPLISLHTSVAVSEDKRAELLAALSRITAESIGKPEQYVMAVIQEGAFLMSGEPGPAAFVEVRSIGGLSANVNRTISDKLCALLSESLATSPERVYINFTEVSASNWGWNSATFG